MLTAHASPPQKYPPTACPNRRLPLAQGFAREAYSRRVLPLVKWKPTPDGNVQVLNDTADFYRYFDATAQAEFLYACVKKTALEDLPKEPDYLRRHDALKAHVAAIVEMPDRTVDLLFRMLRQNKSRLSNRAGTRNSPHPRREP